MGGDIMYGLVYHHLFRRSTTAHYDIYFIFFIFLLEEGYVHTSYAEAKYIAWILSNKAPIIKK
jgi:hypothetical protein